MSSLPRDSGNQAIGTISKVAEKVIGALLFLLIVIFAGSFAAIPGLLFGGPVGAVIAFLVVGIFVAWSTLAFLDWAAQAAVAVVRGLVESQDGPDQPWNRRPEDPAERVKAAPVAQPLPHKPLQRQPRSTESNRTIDSVREPGKLLQKHQLTLKAMLCIHERGLLLYHGMMRPELVASLPAWAARVEIREEPGGNRLIVRDADGSVFCEAPNLFKRQALKLQKRIEDAQK